MFLCLKQSMSKFDLNKSYSGDWGWINKLTWRDRRLFGFRQQNILITFRKRYYVYDIIKHFTSFILRTSIKTSQRWLLVPLGTQAPDSWVNTCVCSTCIVLWVSQSFKSHQSQRFSPRRAETGNLPICNVLKTRHFKPMGLDERLHRSHSNTSHYFHSEGQHLGLVLWLDISSR